jgi:hypothetical protein
MGKSMWFDLIVYYRKYLQVPSMSLAKPKKVKLKSTVRELKIVHSVSRDGVDILKAEEIKTPRPKPQKSSSTSRLSQSSSPKKRLKLDDFEAEPIPCCFEGSHDYKKGQTLVFLLLL